MPDSTAIEKRKHDHLQINLRENVQSGQTNGLERYRLIHEALPELALEDIDLRIAFLGKEIRTPLLISSMTGGADEALRINRSLAEAAQRHGLAMGLGSQRAGLEDKKLQATYQVRDIAPDIYLFANLGAVQLNYGMGADDCRRVVETVQADALFLHLNVLQEAVQPEGNTDFRDLLKKIEQVCRDSEVPVLVKEVGWGISAATARRLADAGVAGIDVAGAGGTSWSEVERHRMKDAGDRATAAVFSSWGIPTADCLTAISLDLPDLPVIASGGLVNGFDAAKCLALGAHMAGMAGPFLRAAAQGESNLDQFVTVILNQLRISMLATGSRTIADLRSGKITRNG